MIIAGSSVSGPNGEGGAVTEKKLLIERQGPILRATLNDPATRNALSRPMIQEISDFLASLNGEQGLCCVVLDAAGDGFCSGGNVKDMRERTDPMFGGTPHEMQEGYRQSIQAIPRLFHTLDVPVIAAVQGVAIGAGCDLACMCDIRVGATDAKFAESFLRVGLVPGDGGAWFLPRIVGVPRAIEMAMTCRMIEAEEAKSWGLVTHVVERAVLTETALDLARRIAAFPPVSIRLNKRLLRQSLQLSLGDCLELSAAFQAIAQSTADQREAVAAIVERRPPAYVGR
ncbi:MAG: enoyl-CoA hydratase/isomerase family protein [Rhodospirillales bacterium]|nr:enoyl-CoA hydratase/isomerase family protein [Rhodospirillales bacterium]